MTLHSMPKTDPVSFADCDSPESDFISIALAFDDTIEIAIVDCTNHDGRPVYTSLSKNDAQAFAAAILLAAT